MPAITKMSDSTAFEAKLDKLNADLNIKIKSKLADNASYAMWMNHDCETQNKSSRLVRIIKNILSFILPISLFEPIKASKVALRYLQFVEKNQEYLQKSEIVEKAKNVLKTLNIRTGSKYALKIEAYIKAIDGLAPKALNQNAPAAQINEQNVIDFLKAMDNQTRINLLNANGFTPPNKPQPPLPPAAPKVAPVAPAAKKTAVASPVKTPAAKKVASPAPAKAPAAPAEAPLTQTASPINDEALKAAVAKRKAAAEADPKAN